MFTQKQKEIEGRVYPNATLTFEPVFLWQPFTFHQFLFIFSYFPICLNYLFRAQVFLIALFRCFVDTPTRWRSHRGNKTLFIVKGLKARK